MILAHNLFLSFLALIVTGPMTNFQNALFSCIIFCGIQTGSSWEIFSILGINVSEVHTKAWFVFLEASIEKELIYTRDNWFMHQTLNNLNLGAKTLVWKGKSFIALGSKYVFSTVPAKMSLECPFFTTE